MTERATPRLKGYQIALGIAVAIVAALWGSFALIEYNFRMNLAPGYLKPVGIEWVRQKSTGFMPGDDDVSLIVYRISPVEAEALKREGPAEIAGACAGATGHRRA